MIGRITGILAAKQAPHLLIDVGGVGYQLQAPMTSIYPLPELGQQVSLHTHLSISDSAHQLFGFYTEEERRLFRALIKVSGVGPKMALAILSGMAVSEFVRCVQNDNSAALIKVPGVGRKTAERLLIDMRDRLKDWSADIPAQPHAGQRTASTSVADDATDALVALGYKATDAAKTVATVQQAESVQTSEALIRAALRHLAS